MWGLRFKDSVTDYGAQLWRSVHICGICGGIELAVITGWDGVKCMGLRIVERVAA